MTTILTIPQAAKTTLEEKSYKLLFAAFTALAAVFFVLVPVWTVPGNDVSFQLSLFSAQNWLLFAVLAPLVALLLTMQVFIFRREKNAQAKSLGGAVGSLGGAYAGILGGVFATAACSWCVAAVFGFLGTGAVLFIAENQFWSVLAAVSIMLAALFFASKKVVDDCDCAA